MDMADLIRVKTASDRIKVTSQYIYTLIENGKLKKTDIDGVTFVSRKAVDEFDATRPNRQPSK